MWLVFKVLRTVATIPRFVLGAAFFPFTAILTATTVSIAIATTVAALAGFPPLMFLSLVI